MPRSLRLDFASLGTGAQLYGAAFLRALRAKTAGQINELGAAPERFLTTPPSIRTVDPALARAFYRGDYTFSGILAQTGGASPFAIKAPSESWEEALHSFRWLRHLHAADTPLAAAQARALVDEWIDAHGVTGRGVAHMPHIAAVRLISFLQFSETVLREADHHFYRKFMGAVGRQFRHLRAQAKIIPKDTHYLQVMIALAFGALVLPCSAAFKSRTIAKLGEALDRQILPDGGHANRNPDQIASLLYDLLPLAQTFLALSQPVPPSLVHAIDRMFPRLRFFIHRDGNLALFHGSGAIDAESLAALLLHDETEGKAGLEAAQSGYRRLESDRLTLIADIGTVPEGSFGANCHASVSAFEFSSGTSRIIVNLGRNHRGERRMPHIARQTAAHSTLEIDGNSSAHFDVYSRLLRWPVTRCVSGPEHIKLQDWGDGKLGIIIGHDGWRDPYGVVHERGLRLTEDGRALEGYDRLKPVSDGKSFEQAQVRFHLHASVHVTRRGENGEVFLVDQSGDEWIFSSDHRLVVEPSLFLSGVEGAEPTQQITIDMGGEAGTASWRLAKNA